MSINGKQSIHYTKKDLETSQSSAVAIGFKKLKFWHEPTVGDTVVDLTSLTFPSSGVPTNAAQPSIADLSAASLLLNKDNLTVISSLSGVLDFDSYEVTGGTEITLAEATAEGELIIGIVDYVAKTGVQVLDPNPIVVTGTLAISADEFIIGTPFDLNKYPSQQQGSILVFLDGQLMARNVGNATAAPGADGNYQEIGTAGLGSSIKFNIVDAVNARSVMVVSAGFSGVAPTESMLALIEKVAGENNKMIPTVAALAGVSESTFTAAPSAVDAANFGNRVVALESYRVIATTDTANSGVDRILADTSGGAFTIDLPLAPNIGDWVEFWDAEGTFTSNSLTVGRNSENIEGVASDFIVSTDDVKLKFVYVSPTRGWIIGDIS